MSNQQYNRDPCGLSFSKFNLNLDYGLFNDDIFIWNCYITWENHAFFVFIAIEGLNHTFLVLIVYKFNE